jgi:hypothetical protein
VSANQGNPWRDLAHAVWHLLDDHAEEVAPGEYQLTDLPVDVWTPEIGRALDALGMIEHDDIDATAERAQACISAMEGLDPRYARWTAEHYENVLQTSERLLEENAQLREKRDRLRAALIALTPPMPPADATCHVGICEQSACAHCQRIAEARTVILESAS